MIELREYRLPNGKAPFSEWLRDLRDREARARIRVRLNRVRLGNFGDSTPLGEGLFELRLMFGPGYRVYFGREGDRLVLLLCGGDKKTQEKDIGRARAAWEDYKRRGHG
jgi:putative addiction module killer protein